jgi:hypothetical protein
MKRLLFLYFLFSSLFCIAQSEWFPIGAKWYYNLQELEQYQADGYEVFTVMKDTIVDSKQSKCISKISISSKGQIYNHENIILQEENKRVYWYNKNSFQLIYDFNLNPGDTLERNISTIGCDSVSPIIVDSISETSINGVPIKIQHLSYVGYNTHFSSEGYTFRMSIMERIGSEDNFMNEPLTCLIGDNFAFTGLRCYIDKNLEYHSDWWKNIYNNIACDTLIYTDTQNLKISKDILISPNPTSGPFIVTSKVPIKTIEIYNILGYKIRTFEIRSNKIGDFDINNYQNGPYIIVITTCRKDKYYTKIIKN